MKKRRHTLVVQGPRESTKDGPGPITTPIYQSATFRQIELGSHAAAERSEMYYTRAGNPTLAEAEERIAALEGADRALVFGSGMAAITTSLLALVSAGGHVVAQTSLYGGAADFLARELPRFGIETTFVDGTNPAAFATALRPTTRLLYLESPTNPVMRITDLEAAAAIARRHGLITVIDNTAASPINQRPAEFGIGLMLHSATKYMAGHSDLMAGAAAGSEELIGRIRTMRGKLGGVMDPHAAFLLTRGLKTLALRMERHNRNALTVAVFLEKHPAVARVHYPMLESHPQHELAAKQMSGGGGLLSFEIRGGDISTAKEFAGSLEVFTMAPSLGGVESLVTVPAVTSHGMLTVAERQAAGVGDNNVRLAVGIEDPEDLIADLERALMRCMATAAAAG